MNPVYERWYGQSFVQRLLADALTDRYMSIKPSKDRGLIRYQRIESPGMIPFALKHWGVEDDHKLYMDLAQWRSMETFSYDTLMRTVQKDTFNSRFQKDSSSMIKHIDCPIDVDAIKKWDGKKTSWRKTWRRASDIKKHLERRKIRYALWNSSENGFQFLIPQMAFFKMEVDPEHAMMEYIRFAKMLRKWKVDMAVYDTRRIIKLPYSLCNGHVVLPLSDEDFNTYHPELTRVDAVVKRIKLLNRGWLMREYRHD